MFRRYLARQFARPSGWIGRTLIAPWLDRISVDMNRVALEQLKLDRTDHVLEVGFGGGGLLALMLRAKIARVHGIDISSAVVDRAAKRFAKDVRSGQLRLSEGSVEAIPLGNGAVDKAVSVNSLYFWKDLPRAMGELARVVRPGGRLVLCFEPPATLRKWPGHRFGFALYDVGDLVAPARRAGFDHPEVVSEVGRQAFLCLSMKRVDANETGDGKPARP
jgi:SAM-dependent methyltransferase